MVATFKFQDAVAFGEATCHSDRAHHRFRSRADESTFFHRGEGITDLSSQFDFEFGRRSVTCAPFSSVLDRGNDGRRGVTENHRSPGEYIIDVGISIQIVKSRAFGSLDEPWLTSDRSEGPDRTVDTSGNEVLGFLKQLDRTCDFHQGREP